MGLNTSPNVTTLAKAGSVGLSGNITLTGGTNITLTQSGNDISIASSGGMSIGAAVTSGTSGAVLYVDASGNLGQSPTLFNWDSVNTRLTVNAAQGDTTTCMLVKSRSATEQIFVIKGAAAQAFPAFTYRDSSGNAQFQITGSGTFFFYNDNGVDVAKTYTTSTNLISISNTLTLDFTSPRFIFASATATLIFNKTLAGSSAFFYHGITYTNPSATARALGNIYAVYDAPILQADTQVGVSSAGYHGFYSAPTTAVNSTGVLTVTLIDQFHADAVTIGASTTVTTRRGVRISDVSSAGTLTNNRGLDVEDIATGTNKFQIYQQGTTSTNVFAAMSKFGSTAVATAAIDITSGQANHIRMAGHTAGPASPTAGDIFYDTTRKHHMAVNAIGTAAFTMCVNAETTSSTAIASTTTETAFSGGFQFPANSITLGRCMRAVWSGIISSTLTPTMQFIIRYGAAATGVLLIDFGAVAAGTSVTNRPWRIEFRGICRTIGASGTIACDAVLFIDNAATTLVTGSVVAQTTNVTATIDTTTATTLNLTATWSANSASNTITRISQHIEVWN